MSVNHAMARLEARIPTDLHAMLKRAADLQGRTMTDFVVAAVREAAQHAIEEAEVMRLSTQDQIAFAQALISVPMPSSSLVKAFSKRKQLLGDESQANREAKAE
ncbi:MAG: DUF1778 domain-containing protein [Ottowia sp.]|nr:DUF1778 domain-containing protein [Ottowia sp.]